MIASCGHCSVVHFMTLVVVLGVRMTGALGSWLDTEAGDCTSRLASQAQGSYLKAL